MDKIGLREVSKVNIFYKKFFYQERKLKFFKKNKKLKK